jgi:Zn-dependent protease with chaperone function
MAVSAFALAALGAAVLLVAVIAPSVLLESHRATEADPDQAPMAHALLAELAPAARIDLPRLFVVPAPQANGFALLGHKQRIIALTEGVFERLDPRQLRGLLALLVARASRPRARIETAIAALALIVAPFVLPSMALVRAGIRGARWHEADSTAAALVGAGWIAETLEKLESERPSVTEGAVMLVTASLFCVSPMAPSSPGWINRVFVTQPPTDARVARLLGPSR